MSHGRDRDVFREAAWRGDDDLVRTNLHHDAALIDLVGAMRNGVGYRFTDHQAGQPGQLVANGADDHHVAAQLSRDQLGSVLNLSWQCPVDLLSAPVVLTVVGVVPADLHHELASTQGDLGIGEQQGTGDAELRLVGEPALPEPLRQGCVVGTPAVCQADPLERFARRLVNHDS